MTLLPSNEEIDGLLDVSMVLDSVERSQRAVAAGIDNRVVHPGCSPLKEEL